MTLDLISWAFVLYFMALNLSYLTLNWLGALSLRRYLRDRAWTFLPPDYGRFEPPVSVLVPAYNEALTIIEALQSVLQLNYHDYEILVINDGSKDQTLAVLRAHFDLQPLPVPGRAVLETARVRGIYRSPRHPRLKVIDKDNGGKADSLNAGLNYAMFPLVCCLDADSILQRDSLSQAVAPFLEEQNLICSGGTVRVANGSQIDAGLMVTPGLSRNPLALFQTIEYLRAFLFGREGWSPLNALLIISGAFGIFDRQALLDVGGYRVQTIGEDMELTVRLHRLYLARRQPYRIRFVSRPICWTEAPEDLKTLRNQRIRWQRGLLESLSLNRQLLFHPRGGAVSWLAFPFFVLFEALGPLIEVSAYLFICFGFLLGAISAEVAVYFFFVSIGFGVLLSISALLLEEISFRVYTRYRHLAILALAAVLENFGYRQLNSWWRLRGTWQWLRGKQASWGDMARKGVKGG
jgi:cellulose synthase/poly-beta-1,6-N-acetylglucosamine synthase-like glycosyltransferase